MTRHVVFSIYLFFLKLTNKQMSTDGYKIRDQYAVHFITFSVIEWIVFSPARIMQILSSIA